jgi:hypothetical protein
MHRNRHVAPPMPEFVLRPNRAGAWIVSDRAGLKGGIFRSRKAAVRFVRNSSCGRRFRIAIVPGAGHAAA